MTDELVRGMILFMIVVHLRFFSGSTNSNDESSLCMSVRAIAFCWLMVEFEIVIVLCYYSLKSIRNAYRSKCESVGDQLNRVR